jgi:hypothetical protein
MLYNVLADIVVAIHFAFLAFVIVGQLLIVVGALLGWQWIRNPWFRWGHFVAILFVVVNTIREVTCPLTDLEDWLRELGKPPEAQSVTERISFVGRIIRDIIFYDIPDNDDIFKITYSAFGLIVLGSFLLAPPRGCERVQFWRRRPREDAVPARQES